MENEALKYLNIYEHNFWNISEENYTDPPQYVFELTNQVTIAYHNYIKEVIEFIADSGCPSLGALLLVIIATNPDCEDDIEFVKNNFQENKQRFVLKEDFFRYQSAIDFLYLLKSLPEEYKQGENRKLLIRRLFQNGHNTIGGKKAKKVLQDFEISLDKLTSTEKERFNKAVFINDFRTIALLKKAFPLKESIINAFHNVTDVNFQSSLKEELVANEKETSLLGANFDTILINDAATFHIGSLIKNIWAGLSVPMHHNFAGLQPLGGVTDLTNKGDFDKLLISEFAYDDDIFMSRLANNEALFIEREIPPQKNTFVRYILLDTSIYNWGIPKKIAFALALAIAKHPKSDVSTKIILVGEKAEEMAFASVTDIITATKNISGKLDCASGIVSFFNENTIVPNQAEVFFIASESVFGIEKFQKVMYDHFNQINYAFSISLEGFVQVFKHQTKAKICLQTISLPLEDLWKKEQHKQEILNFSSDGNSPVLYHVVPEFNKMFVFENDFYFVKNFCLFKFHKPDFKKGVALVFANLPVTSGQFFLKKNNKGHLVLTCKSEKNILYRANITTKEFGRLDREIEFPGDVSVDSNQTFLQLQKSGYLKITVKQTLDSAFIVDGSLFINGFEFKDWYFRRVNRPSIILNNSIEFHFEQKANLYFKKNRSGANLEIIKCITTNSNKTLKEATSIINTSGGLVLEDVSLVEVEALKKKLEDLGAVCYFKISSLYTADGRRITIDNGTLKLEDSSTNLCIYIPFLLKSHTVAATHEYYAGNDFYIPENSNLKKITEEEFKTRFLNLFIHKSIPNAT
ncbi:hypothetical protein BWK58_07485 [Flavobacterium columnare]|nr:hypothetical protein BWK58_07485 [Flavobacterium columnare]